MIDPNKKEKYIFFGGGFGGKILALFYPFWVFVLFLHLLFNSFKKNNIVFAIDFDTALPSYFVSLIRPKFKYIYDIHDDFSLRYNFPYSIKLIIGKVDFLVKKNAFHTIHVDESRVRDGDKLFTVIYNTPKDFYNNQPPKLRSFNPNKFVVSGLLCAQRGICSLTKFASDNPNFHFIVAGEPIDSYASEFIKLNNVEYLGYVDQDYLFSKIHDVAFIFSLYDPSLEINRLAASNKLYDSMMMGIPVIVNKDILAANFVKKNDIGIIVSFNYDSSWDCLRTTPKEIIELKGSNGRKLYEKNFSYESNFTKKLDLIIKQN